MNKNKGSIKLAILAISCVMMASLTASAILSDISIHFNHVDKSIIQMVLTIPSLLGMIFALIAGPLSTKISKKALVLSGLVSGFAGGTLAFFLGSISIYVLLFSSVLIGIGQGVNSTMSMALIADYFQGDDCSSLMGLQSAFVNGGTMLILLCSGSLASIHWNYSYIVFLAFIPILFIVAKKLPYAPPQPMKADNGEKVKLNGTIYYTCFTIICFAIFMFVFQTNISLFIHNNHLGTATSSGLVNSTLSGVGAITGILYSRIRKLLKNYIIPTALIVTAIGMTLPFSIGTLTSVFIAAACTGFGLSLIMPTTMYIVSSSVAPCMSATAIAIGNASSNLGMFISPLLINPLARILGDGSERIKFLISAIGLLALALIVLLVNTRITKSDLK